MDVWWYPWEAPVPGARDLTVRGALRQAGCEEPGELTPALLTWACGLQDVVAPVPRVGEDLLDLVVGMEAPELAVDRLLGVGDLATMLGISRAEVDGRVMRGRLPSHQLVVAGARRWARPIVTRSVGVGV